MGSQEVLESNMVLDSTDGNDPSSVSGLCGGEFESEAVGSGVKLGDNINVDIVEDLDSMMEDIEDRLRISRMVSDSVIKGIVNAVEQEADEKIKAKELELATLKQSLQFSHVNGDENEASWLQEIHREPESVDSEGYLDFEDACLEHDKMRESLAVLKKSATEQFKKLKKLIECGRGCKIRRIGSRTELVGLGGILKEKECENWVNIDKTLDSLGMMIHMICRRADTMLRLSKTTLCEWQQEQELKGELEAVVMQSTIRCLREEFEEELWDQNNSLYGRHNVAWAERSKEISGLRNELDALRKLLPSSDPGHLLSHGSFDIDNTPVKPLSTQLSSQWEENGKSDESKTDVPETFDAVQLKHLSREELVSFFNDIKLKIKREHESEMQQMAEKYYSLKGKYLSEKRSVLPHSKDFETLRKKIPEVVSKLDGILVQNDCFPGHGSNVSSSESLKNRLDTLLSENRQLRDSLADKKNEVRCLSSELSVASEQILQHALSEANFHKLIKTLTSSKADTQIEASIVEDVYQCVVRDLGDHIQSMKEVSELEIIAMHDSCGVLLGAANVGAKTTSLSAIGDTCMESVVMQGLLETIFKVTIEEAQEKFESLFKEYLNANENVISLEKKAMEREADLNSEVEQRQRLRKEVQSLGKLMEEKERLGRELEKEREQFELASVELHTLREQGTLLSKTKRELDEISTKFLEAQEQIEVDKTEISSLNQKLDLAMEEIKAADDCRNMVLALTQEKQRYRSLFDAKEKEQKKQMEAIVVLVDGLSTKLADFECRVAGSIQTNKMRLEYSSSQLSSLIKAANVFRRTGLLYKQKLERKCSDLQMAEDEVDLLGDEVETLLSLLEKIYVALDHYSPVLQHYPGVIEILKLIRRELSGESLKAH